MDISLIPIQHKFKFSQQALKRLSTKDPKLPTRIPECYSGFTDIKEIPGVRYRMYLDVSIENNISFFSPRFTLYDLKDKQIRGTFAFYIKTANYASPFGSELFKSDFWELDCSNSFGYGPVICSFEDLFNPEKKFIINGECCIEVKGIFHLESSIENCENQHTLGRYLWNRDDHDFTIYVGKENELKTKITVHKLILAARSPVFDAMLYTNMKEKAESKVEITDFDAKIVQAAVEYCYDQDYGISYDENTEAAMLLQFADKYDIKDLKNELEQFFVKVALPEDICEIANAAVISNSIKLRDFCIQKMVMFLKMEIPIDNIEILDKDFATEFMKKAFSFKK